MPQWPTYNNASDALSGVAASLQVLGDDCEDTRGQSHVEETMSLWTTTLELLEVLVKVLEGLVLVVLAGNVCAELAEVLKLLLNLLGGGLHVRLDAPQILLMVHLGAGISDDSDILREELVTVLESYISYSVCCCAGGVGRDSWKVCSPIQRARGTMRIHQSAITRRRGGGVGKMPTVFFLAKSPEAPRTTMTVFSLSSTFLLQRPGSASWAPKKNW